MRIFKTKWFARFARRQRITDSRLTEAVRRATAGLIDADLGSGVIKQRVSRPGQGRSGGFRVLMAYRPKARAVFIYGFAKSERENIGEHELETARDIAKAWLEADSDRLNRAIAVGLIWEVADEEDNEDT